MKEITAESGLVAKCGLYCGACRKFLKDKCPGCTENAKAAWCKVRKCCIIHNYLSCADCNQYKDFRNCKKLNNPISKLIGRLLGSDRLASLDLIREKGYRAFAEEMASKRSMSVKRCSGCQS